FAGSTRVGGFGLGLPIARELLRAQGGDISLLETSAQGTCFVVRLPL
ncbi:MAG: ATP-binding protein, partial [Rhodospirillaceae bacterium]|nr:ATP-binding protein [Rhodospirillaceae bacterium]